jgi:hypothetical protein
VAPLKGATQVRAVSEPKWKHWNNLAHVELEAAIELSVGVEPNSLGRGRTDRFTPPDVAELRREIGSRYRIAESHSREGRLSPSFKDLALPFFGSGDKLYVKLGTLRRWGESLPEPLTFPELFPRSDPPPQQTSSGTRTGQARIEPGDNLDSRGRTSLLRIIRAMDAMLKLPERGASGSIEAQLQKLGFDGPKEAPFGRPSKRRETSIQMENRNSGFHIRNCAFAVGRSLRVRHAVTRSVHE